MLRINGRRNWLAGVTEVTEWMFWREEFGELTGETDDEIASIHPHEFFWLYFQTFVLQPHFNFVILLAFLNSFRLFWIQWLLLYVSSCWTEVCIMQTCKRVKPQCNINIWGHSRWRRTSDILVSIAFLTSHFMLLLVTQYMYKVSVHPSV